MRLPRKLGPGLLVTAAFFGPGTVTTASKAGAGFGLALLWCLLFAVVATVVLQEMSARLGIVTRAGLGEAIRSTFAHAWVRWPACGLVLVAIGCGNAAYQTGNITGAATALEAVGGLSTRGWALAVAMVAAALLASGTYRVIERVLIGLVCLMSAIFLLTAVVVRPDLTALIQGTFVPTVPTGSLTTIVALIGTTVVPYNLFLHASSVGQRWPEEVPREVALGEARWDTVLSVCLGGIVTMAIVVTAAAQAHQGEIASAADMARQLEPLLGGAAEPCFALGLFAAGLTSAITAPLAAAYATAGVLGWEVDLKSWRLRGVWLAVLLAGTLAAVTAGTSPAETIVLAQVANGFLLPLVALFLLVVVNRTALMGTDHNGPCTNLLGAGVVLLVTAITAYKLYQQFL